jgi:hypothetical protein
MVRTGGCTLVYFTNTFLAAMSARDWLSAWRINKMCHQLMTIPKWTLKTNTYTIPKNKTKQNKNIYTINLLMKIPKFTFKTIGH